MPRLTAGFVTDPGATTVLILCSDCPWRHHAADREAAWTAAAAHARGRHPDQVTAALSAVRGATYRKRHGPA